MVRKNSIFQTVSLLPATPRKPIPWGAAPLLLPTLSFACGIAVHARLDYGYGSAFAGVAGTLLLASVLWHLRPRPPRYAGPAGLLLLAAIFAGGAWYAGARHPLNRADHFSRFAGESAVLAGRVLDLRPAGERTAATLDIEAVGRDSLAYAATGKLLAYLGGADSLRPGQRIVLVTPPARVPPPLNPGVFDYAAYLAGQSVYHRAYADSAQWRVVPGVTPFRLGLLGERSRAAWFASLTPYLDGDDLAVAAALIMGKRDLLGTEVRSAYADTGAIHVLAVSGLHVGIMALLVMQVLGWLLPRGRAAFAVRSAVTVAAVWYFALVTGLSPSVQRAALMVTVVLVGKSLHRRNSIYNLLAIAALAMLVVEPKQLFQVGFQLSFAAVLGIALFARRIQRLLPLPGRWRMLWDAVSVSTAAQLGTLPFSLYYFGQFPVYFLLSGTLVIVFAYAVLGLGLLHGLLALTGVPAATGATGTLLGLVVGLQNAFIRFCQALPGATVTFDRFGLASALGLTLLIAVLAYLAYRPSHRGRWACLAVAGTLCTFWLLRPLLAPLPRQFTVYHLPRLSLIDVYDGARGRSVGDTVPPATLGYQVEPARKGIAAAFSAPHGFDRDTSDGPLAVAYPLLRLLNRRVLVLDGDGPSLIPTDSFPEVDLVLVRNGYRSGSLPPALAPLPIVVDGSSPPYVTRDWRAAYPEAHVTAYDGAYRYVE